jgi:hypothetical protein
MIRECLILGLLSLLPLRLSAAADTTGDQNSFPLYLPHTNRPLFGTQITLSAGTGRVSRTDRPMFSLALECKEVYNLTGALFISGGNGLSLIRSQARPVTGDRFERQVLYAYIPAGIGFSMGDDRAAIITSVDALSGAYLYNGPKSENSRRFAYGLAPEFGFLFHTGRRYHRDMEIGMTGKVRFMQTPDRNDGSALRYCYGGIGLMLRF